MTETVGFIGLGLMGKPMAINLVKAGYDLLVHSRSPGPVEELVSAGAKAAASPAEIAKKCMVIITMLPDSPEVELVLSGADGVFAALRSDSVILDMSTIAPFAAKALAEEATRYASIMLDAPVSGGEIGAINGTLSIMVGGDSDALDKVRPLLEVMGNPERIVHIGASGAGQLCKACNQLVIGGTLAAVGEAVTLAHKAGVDFAKVREALLGGFAASTVLEVHGERALKQDFKPGFRAEMFHKDMGIILDTARSYDVPMPVTAIVQQLVSALLASGHGKDDYSSLITVLQQMASLPQES